MVDPYVILRALSQDRPVFHSEADFQHAFAWQLHTDHPDWGIRLEYPFHSADRQDDRADHLDLLLFRHDETMAFELKYKTNPFLIKLGTEMFYLKGQSAQDCGRYDFLKDIKRLEEYVSQRKNSTGYALLLTNDGSYWSPGSRAVSICDEFRLTDNRDVTGELNWSTAAGKGTTKGREAPIRLHGRYTCNWDDYHEFPTGPDAMGSRRFRHLVIKVA